MSLKSARAIQWHSESPTLNGSYKAVCLCLCKVELVLPESMLEHVHHCTVKSHIQQPSSHFFPPGHLCTRFSLRLPETTCLFCLYVSICSKCLESRAHGYVLVTGNFPSLPMQCKPPTSSVSIPSPTLSTLYSRVCDMACYFLPLLTWFPSFVGLEFHSYCDSVTRLW